LWNYRKVVGAKYSDFQARSPNRELPIILALALTTLEDVSTNGSQRPNLMLPEAVMQYGL
jgi:hypothetical protein